MRQLILTILVGTVFFLLPSTEPAWATQPKVTMPHTVSITLEPESVSVGSVARITLTFIPCVDVKNLRISFSLPREHGAQVLGSSRQKWTGDGKKDEAITFSGLVCFENPGMHLVFVTYRHPDPRRPQDLRSDVITFYIRVPGGIVPPPRDEREGPYQVERAPAGARGPASDGQLLHFPAEGKADLARDSVFMRCSGDGDTLWAETAYVIATCDKLFGMAINKVVINFDNWRVVPPSLGSVVELPDYRARFTAGSTAGLGKVLADGDGFVWAIPVMVIAD